MEIVCRGKNVIPVEDISADSEEAKKKRTAADNASTPLTLVIYAHYNTMYPSRRT